ncbi:MAG: hypothetical protein BWY67_01929 [Bacteroidetes bacterium ADurb.Bin397]|nr:MAG: hypothetical protein BWY67_01929 [Bacteroidetes bacterium ADurb.Bin397]
MENIFLTNGPCIFPSGLYTTLVLYNLPLAILSLPISLMEGSGNTIEPATMVTLNSEANSLKISS